MPREIKKYPVRHPLLRRYVQFFWSFQVDWLEMDHKLIPQRTINVRFNLSETPHFLSMNDAEQLLENAYFSGLQDHCLQARIKLSGKVDVMGVCFYPDGFYPFLNMPICECKNQLLGADEVGFKTAKTIVEWLQETPDIDTRLTILEQELVTLLVNNTPVNEHFRQLVHAVTNLDGSMQLTAFCKRHTVNIRTVERLFNKYVGVSAKTYSTLERFHKSVNQILQHDYSKLSDLAYDNGYFDQMHLIKEFKRFSGNTPKAFVQQNNSILHLAKMR